MTTWLPFTHGGVEYPLTGATIRPLIEDADPSLFLLRERIADAIEFYVGDRFLAQAALEGLSFPSAVVQRTHVEPMPLQADQFNFPTLSLHRKSEVNSDRTVTFRQDVAELEVVYLLPPLSLRLREQLEPILRSVAVVIQEAVNTWRDVAIPRARALSVRYGGYEQVQEIPNYYRAVFGTIELTERDMPTTTGRTVFAGANLSVETTDEQNTTVEVVQSQTQVSPTIASLDTTIGTSAGGTTVTITGTGFLDGQPVRVWFGGVESTSAIVLSDTQVQAVTPPHNAYPDFIADVEVQNLDGLRARLSAAFTFTTP